ncbi:MAG: HNH endonuclease [Acidimicrobiia bacterium]|nr:HNH endonuclease [Acidimicrobiia bacterium]
MTRCWRCWAASRLRRAAAALEVLAARRVEELGAYRRAGYGSTARLLAARGATSLVRAGEVVETAKRLGSCPRTEQALVAGEVSVEQAHVITGAVAVVPGAEEDLLALAGTGSLRSLRERARDVRLEAEEDRLGRYRRQHAARGLVHGRDDEGMVWGRFRLPPDLGAAVVHRLEHQGDAEYRTACREGRREAHDRYLADALVTLVTGAVGAAVGSRRAGGGPDPGDRPTGGDRTRGPARAGGGEVPGTAATGGDTDTGEAGDPVHHGEPGEAGRSNARGGAGGAGRPGGAVGVVRAGLRPAPRVDVVVHVSHEALRRGSVEPGETCTIQGVGPIPLEQARELADDAFVKGVLVDGTEVTRVRHFGRRIPAELRTALEVRAVLTDGDVVCSVPGCDRRAGLEWDHDQPHAAGGPTSYQTIQALCRDHHREKTSRDRCRPGPSPTDPDPP